MCLGDRPLDEREVPCVGRSTDTEAEGLRDQLGKAGPHTTKIPPQAASLTSVGSTTKRNDSLAP